MCSSAGFARDRVGGDDARLRFHGAPDRASGHATLAVQINECLGAPAECLRIDDRRIADYHALILQAIDPSFDGRSRQMDVAPDVLIGPPGVLSQQRND